MVSKAEFLWHLMYWYTSFRVSNVIKLFLCVFDWHSFVVQLYTVYIIHERVSCCLSQRPTSRLWIFTGFYSIAIFRTVSKQFVSKNKNNNDKLSILIILKHPFVLKLYIMFNQNQVWLNDWIAFYAISANVYAISAIFQPYIGKYD